MKLTKYIGSQFSNPRGFGGRISTYFMNRLNRAQYKCVRDQLLRLSPTAVLDIGFGNGYLLHTLSQRSSALFCGAEISDDMLAQGTARNNGAIATGKMRLVRGTASALPFREAAFDLAYTVNTVYFWDDLEAGYHEIARVLKPGGTFANVFYAKDWLDRLPSTQYGFTKYTPRQLLEKVRGFSFAKTELLELKKGSAYCLLTTK